MNDFLSRYDRMKRLNNRPEVGDDYERQRINRPMTNESFIFLLCMVFMGAALILTLVSYYNRSKKSDNPCSACHAPALLSSHTDRHAAMTDYFRKAGNPHPEAIARAVLQPEIKRPKLLAAMATKGELNTPYTVRHGGYKQRHAGSWQVNEADWGPVPYELSGQARKTDAILESLVKSKDMKEALNFYAGDKTKKSYARVVLAEAKRVP